MQKLVIIGGGFAGFWSAVSAIRQARELNKAEELKVILISKDDYHTIRPRLYEPFLEGTRVSLRQYCEPLNIDLVCGEATRIDPINKNVSVSNLSEEITYDYLILAAGSRLKSPQIPGFEKAFNVDTYEAASKLDLHLKNLAQSRFRTEASKRVVVVGAGMTGLEIAASFGKRLKDIAQSDVQFKVFLVEKAPEVASDFSGEGREYIKNQLKNLGVELISGDEIKIIEIAKINLKSGKSIEAETLVWAGGLEASPLTASFNGKRDEMGRLYVDDCLKLPDYETVFVAGDSARALTDDNHYALMSCQHAMPQGKLAGHNVTNLMFGEKMTPYRQPHYQTCLDLGPENALLTMGWDRKINKTGPEVKILKNQITRIWICPPKSIEETLVASIPEVPNV